MKKNELFNSVGLDYTEDGQCVVKVDNFPYFVKGLLREEKATLKVLNEKKTYGYAKVENIIESCHRRQTICPLYPKCGGCQIMHMDKDEQAFFKTQKVKNAIKRIGRLDNEVLDIIRCKDDFKYRNKVQIPVEYTDTGIKAGFYRTYSHDIVDLDSCLLQSDLSNEIYKTTLELIKKFNYKTIRHILIKHAFKTNEVMVALVTNTYKLENTEDLVKDLINKHPEIKTIVLNLNTKNDNVILGNDNKVLFNDGYITDELLGLKFRISTNSFYQVNHDQCEVLYSKALEFAEIGKDDVVADVYGGIGTIGLIASKRCKKVYGIEIVDQAVKDAMFNAKLNNIENAEYITSDAKEATSKWVKDNIKIDIAFIDPPRKGCDDETINSLVKLAPKKIVYISCDPATLARDLRIFNDKGYKIGKIQPVDMFPNTSHVECVVKMQRK